MSVPLFIVDAFTAAPFAGNPAGVCLLPAWRSEGWMQALAAEMNLAETAFVVPEGPRFGLRWFTPEVEVPLCGHATLASSHVLFESGRAPADGCIEFMSAGGRLTAERTGDRIQLDFPAIPVTACEPPPALAEALGTTPEFVGRTVPRGPRGDTDYLCVLRDEETVRSLQPHMGRLREVGGGVIVTATGSAPYAIVSRFFAPGYGIDEDPVTGGAHCALGPYWAPRLGLERLRAFQASPRGGELEVTVHGDRVGLIGRAVTVLAGECRV
jgi:PhzF family phenazine biosynthesis protein